MLSFAQLAKRSVAGGLRRQALAARSIRTSAPNAALSKFGMPAMSPTMTEGGVAEWKIKEGDSFAAGDVLIEVETDKATIDVEAQEDGILAKIIIQNGGKGIPVGTPIAVLAEEGDDLSKVDAFAAESEAAAPKEEAPKEEKKEEKKDESKAATTPAVASPAKAPEHPSQGDRPKFFASPLARKIALEKGIPLGEIKGTGPQGRIVEADVQKYKPSASSSSAAASAPAAAPAADYEDIPVSNMRRTIGKRLSESKQQLPHYYVTVEVNMGKSMCATEVFNKAGEGKTKLSVNDFVVKAASLALAEVPEANSAWLGETIRQHKKADICIAVATPNGLITPIVKDVGAKGLATISAETKALALRARDGKLKPEEYQGGTFTISNLGMFGVDQFTAIINPPQSCILAVGKTSTKLELAPEDPKGFKAVQVMKVTLSADHRTVDGAVGARWLKAFREYLEQPLSFML
ncbi:pyruvate dehydrogenase complex dihydrolipoamide acetyltransferase [Cryptococcus amylolentus CBS 6273]|uniref:Acetyltransferase component of pyruvate dehydrogenase complex n=1 Tax=Cryptococcus amylolentus CBS 6273 TaxID=1296118 RepID=A0A1E3KAJ3_9TREE|nr:pyruvate dehydrogenase complex dihydrolipoamide acetyltransferase [Cryptococcus amylolentus CBS 6273]